MCRLRLWNRAGSIALLTILAVYIFSLGQVSTSIASSELLTPTPDRLAEPVLPENPSQYEQGLHLYWLNCMPCHGDMGQGLTNEFRSLWVEDHQDCWTSGCHGGRANDEGFPLPRTIPAIVSSYGHVLAFETEADLYEYLRTTHPPQRPGKLTEDEYWAVAAYILTENEHLPPGKEIGPQAEVPAPETGLGLVSVGILLLVLSSIVIWTRRRHKSLIS